MRYSIISRQLNISQLQLEVQRCGGRNLRVASASKQIFCDLSDEGVAKLRAIQCSVNKVGGVKAVVMPPVITPPTPVAAIPTYSPEELVWAAGLDDLRGLTEPPLFGEGLCLAIIDTGILESHEKINGRVVYSENFTTDEMRDHYNHGTAVASIIIAVAPLCNILNLKVLDDLGEGTEEDVVLAIDLCITLNDTNSPIAPSVINLSLGSPDDANPDNPLRVACRAALDKGIWILASAGNSGPTNYTITNPACEKYVIAVGSAKYLPEESSFIVSDFSSRGPTLEGLTKPELVMFGEDILVASSAGVAATVAKSGTSFSTPFFSGITLLYHEACFKWVAYEIEMLPGVLPRGTIGLERIPIPVEMMVDRFFPLTCSKPQGVAPGKDNDYGDGFPLGALIYEALTARPAMDISTLMGSIMPIMGIAMLSMVMTSLTKGLK